MDISIGERIKKRRKELNITQPQIKEATGISSGNMSGIEAGRSLPSASALIGLSKVLNCSIDWILTGNSPISEGIILSNIEEAFINDFRSLPEEEKEELIAILHVKLQKIQQKREKNSKLKSSLSSPDDNNTMAV